MLDRRQIAKPRLRADCRVLVCPDRGVLPLIAIGIAKAGGERFNNRHPRVWLDKQPGYRARAIAAQSKASKHFRFSPLPSSLRT